MAFKTGHEKVGGRQKGSLNRTNRDLKERITQIVENGFESLEDDLEALEAKDRVNAYMRLLEFILPKQRETKIDISSLTDSEVEQLLEQALNKMNENHEDR